VEAGGWFSVDRIQPNMHPAKANVMKQTTEITVASVSLMNSPSIGFFRHRIPSSFCDNGSVKKVLDN
jgi:hypothetical protein